MIAAGQWQPVILESELPGDTSRKLRASANWLPGHCGLLPLLALRSRKAAGHRSSCGSVILKNTNRQLASPNRRSLSSAVGLKPSLRRFRGELRQALEPTSDAVRGGWPWTAFYFCATALTALKLSLRLLGFAPSQPMSKTR